MSDVANAKPLRLNLGGGYRKVPGYLNVDKVGQPDLVYDLEKCPWPWPDDSVDDVIMHHVIEHLGQTTEAFFDILKELYRVCRHNARIQIATPHPRHDDFLGDPTHVRAFTVDSFALYSKAKNREWLKNGSSNSPLGLELNVDFNLASVQYDLDQPWAAEYDAKRITSEQVLQATRQYNNVVKQIRVTLMVNKTP